MMLLVVPLTAASGGMLFGLYLALTSGMLRSASRNFGPSSTTISFAESPFWFVVFLLLQAAIAATLIVMTWIMARLALKAVRTRA